MMSSWGGPLEFHNIQEIVDIELMFELICMFVCFLFLFYSRSCVDEGPGGAPARAIHPGSYRTVPLGETIPSPAPPQRWTGCGKDRRPCLGWAECKGAVSWYEPDRSSAFEATNDMLSRRHRLHRMRPDHSQPQRDAGPGW